MPNDIHIYVDGIVAARNKEPYVRLHVNGELAQLTIAEAFKVANDLVHTASRTEADAMLFRFFDGHDFPQEAVAALMRDFRFFRQRQDDQPVKGSVSDPESGETIK
jgi:hypothetical protein